MTPAQAAHEEFEAFFWLGERLALPRCACGRPPRLTPSGNTWALACICGREGEQGTTPAQAIAGWRKLHGLKENA